MRKLGFVHVKHSALAIISCSHGAYFEHSALARQNLCLSRKSPISKKTKRVLDPTQSFRIVFCLQKDYLLEKWGGKENFYTFSRIKGASEILIIAIKFPFSTCCLFIQDFSTFMSLFEIGLRILSHYNSIPLEIGLDSRLGVPQ